MLTKIPRLGLTKGFISAIIDGIHHLFSFHQRMFQAIFTRLEKRPILSFIVVLGVLFGVIALSSTLRTPGETAAPSQPDTKSSRLFTVGQDGNFLTATAQVKKSDTIDIIALTPGIIQSVLVRPGQRVTSGQTVATLTADYASGSATLNQERAALQTDLTERNYSLERDIIELERKIAKSDSSKSDREESVAIKNLRLELERLKLGRETARIDLELARRSDAALHPKALTSGSVEHIAVRPGDLVSAGTVLMTVHATTGSSTLEAVLPKKLADALQSSDITTLQTNETPYSLPPGYIAQSENAAGLVVVTYPLPHDLSNRLAQNDFVTVSVPLVNRYRDGFLVPIDAIRSTSVATSVIVMETDHSTRSQSVTLGETIGSSVVINSGLAPGEAIVLNATVLPGEKIEPIR
jgi:RND family efflux transporter MFP subunit